MDNCTSTGNVAIRGPITLTNALIALVRSEGFLRVMDADFTTSGGAMELTLVIDISPEQLEQAATLLRSTLDQPTRKAKEVSHG